MSGQIHPFHSHDGTSQSLAEMDLVSAFSDLGQSCPDQCWVAWFEGQAISRDSFVAEAHALAARLPDSKYVLNVCHNRYYFLLGFVAALLRNQISVFPANQAQKTIEALAQKYEAIYCLCDGDDPARGKIPSLFVAQRPGCDCATTPLNFTLSFARQQLAALVFTSGSSGEPLAVEKTWGAILQEARLTVTAMKDLYLSVDAIVASVTPMHMYGFLQSIIIPMQLGIMLEAGQPFFPADIAGRLQNLPHRSLLITTPIQLRHCLLDKLSLPRLHGIICSTAPLDVTVAREAEQHFQVPLYEIYGSTETGAIATRRPVESSNWRMLDGMSISLRDNATRVAASYLSAEVLLQDRIEMVDSRHFRLLGRHSDLIKIGGKRASLSELNRQLLSIDGVIDGVIFDSGMRSVNFGEIRLAMLVVAPQLTRDRLLAELRARLDPVFVPRQVRMLKTLPRNGAGKLPREKLLQALLLDT